MFSNRYNLLVETNAILGVTPYCYDSTTQLYEKSLRRVLFTWIFKIFIILAIFYKPIHRRVAIGVIEDLIFDVATMWYGVMGVFVLLRSEKDFDVVVRTINVFQKFDKMFESEFENDKWPPNKTFIIFWILETVLYGCLTVGDFVSYIFIDEPFYYLTDYWYFITTFFLIMLNFPVILSIENDFGKKFERSAKFFLYSSKNAENMSQSIEDMKNIYVLLVKSRSDFHQRFELFMLGKFVHGYISAVGSCFNWLVLGNSSSGTWMALVYAELLLIIYYVEVVNIQVNLLSFYFHQFSSISINN